MTWTDPKTSSAENTVTQAAGSRLPAPKAVTKRDLIMAPRHSTNTAPAAAISNGNGTRLPRSYGLLISTRLRIPAPARAYNDLFANIPLNSQLMPQPCARDLR